MLPRDDAELSRQKRYKKAAQLIRQWLDQDDDYDARVWPLLAEELADSRLRLREDIP